MRRASLVAGLALLAGCGIHFDPFDPRHGPSLVEAAQTADAAAHRLVAAGAFARRDGYVYAQDLAPLLLYAALRNDRPLYQALLPEATRLVWQKRDDPETDGFVQWRRRGAEAPGITDTTEALRLAQALWRGSRQFGRAEDEALALKVLAGYARHARLERGHWYVSKYYVFGSRSHAALSPLSNYAPDFLAELGRERPDGPWRELAERSYAVLEQARSPGGLLYPLVQPGMERFLPGLVAYGPNDMAALAEGCEAADAARQGRPRLADGVLDIAADGDSWDRSMPFAYYDGRSGEPISLLNLSGTGYACLARLAAARERGRLYRRLEPQLRQLIFSAGSLPSAQEAPLHVLGLMLLTAEAVGAFRAPAP